MRNRVLLIAAISIVAAGMPAAAQKATADRSAKDIVCALSGDCGDASLDASKQMAKPDEAAFSFRAMSADTKQARAAAPATAQARMAPSSKRIAATAGSPRTTPVRSLDMRVTFGNGSAEMTERGRVNAREFAQALGAPQLESRRFAVEGHTDAVGGRDYNMKLSQARAQAVASYLESLGVSSGRIEPKGYGFDHPLPSVGARSPANRRVEIVPL